MIHLIQRFGRDIKVIRNNKEVIFVDGYAQETGADENITIRASVQPVTPEDLEALPEGSDSKEAIKLYTIEKLNVRQGNPPKKGDFFEFDNRRYEVFACEDHTMHNAMNIFYYKIIGTKVSYDA